MVILHNGETGGPNQRQDNNLVCSLDLAKDTKTLLPLTQPASDPRALFNLLQVCSMYYYGKPYQDLEQTHALLPGMTDLMQNGRERLAPLSEGKKTFDFSPQPA
jgi:hypothetical protein